MTATPAAPAPDTTARRSPRPRPVSRAALRRAASTTTAVPCWSSWKTGMSSRSSSRRSISKQRGALMSSRLMPAERRREPDDGLDDVVDAVASRQIGTASTPPNSLNSTALPSITGSAAAGPMSPSPSTALPSVTTATTCDFQVRSCDQVRVLGDGGAHPGDPGRVGQRQVVPVAQRDGRDASPACRPGAARTPGRPRRTSTARTASWAWARSLSSAAGSSKEPSPHRLVSGRRVRVCRSGSARGAGVARGQQFRTRATADLRSGRRWPADGPTSPVTPRVSGAVPARAAPGRCRARRTAAPVRPARSRRPPPGCPARPTSRRPRAARPLHRERTAGPADHHQPARSGTPAPAHQEVVTGPQGGLHRPALDEDPAQPEQPHVTSLTNRRSARVGPPGRGTCRE